MSKTLKNKEFVENLRQMLEILVEATELDISKLILPTIELIEPELLLQLKGAKVPLLWKCELPVKYAEILYSVAKRIDEDEAFFKAKLAELKKLKRQLRARKITDEDEILPPEA